MAEFGEAEKESGKNLRSDTDIIFLEEKPLAPPGAKDWDSKKKLDFLMSMGMKPMANETASPIATA